MIKNLSRMLKKACKLVHLIAFVTYIGFTFSIAIAMDLGNIEGTCMLAVIILFSIIVIMYEYLSILHA